MAIAPAFIEDLDIPDSWLKSIQREKLNNIPMKGSHRDEREPSLLSSGSLSIFVYGVYVSGMRASFRIPSLLLSASFNQLLGLPLRNFFQKKSLQLSLPLLHSE